MALKLLKPKIPNIVRILKNRVVASSFNALKQSLFKIKLVRLYKKKIIIPGCKSLTEGLKIIDEINDTSQKIKLVIEK